MELLRSPRGTAGVVTGLSTQIVQIETETGYCLFQSSLRETKMKIAGQEIKEVMEEVLVLPRLSGDIVFRARGLESWDDFNKMCPEPKCPMKLVKGRKVHDVDDPNWKSDMESYSERKLAYLAIKSLEPTEIEWDTVDLDKPSTWPKWQEDLKNAKFNDVERQRILQLVLEANCLSEAKLSKARELFLSGLVAE